MLEAAYFCPAPVRSRPPQAGVGPLSILSSPSTPKIRSRRLAVGAGADTWDGWSQQVRQGWTILGCWSAGGRREGGYTLSAATEAARKPRA